MVVLNPDLEASRLIPLVLLYVGPEVLLPVTSALAAIAGIALMFWNKIVGLCRGAWQTVFRRKA